MEWTDGQMDNGCYMTDGQIDRGEEFRRRDRQDKLDRIDGVDRFFGCEGTLHGVKGDVIPFSE